MRKIAAIVILEIAVQLSCNVVSVVSTPIVAAPSTLTVNALQTPVVQATIARSAPTVPIATAISTQTLIGTDIIPAAPVCDAGDQLPYVYSPGRLQTVIYCIHVEGHVDEITKQTDGDLRILLKLDPGYTRYLTAGNGDALGDLVVEAICFSPPTQADAKEPCRLDRDPLRNFPTLRQHVWMEGRLVMDSNHGGWAAINPLGRWGVIRETVLQPTRVFPIITATVHGK